MTRLEFGKSTTPEQALLRLPYRDHPLYDEDEVIEHLANFGDNISKLIMLAIEDPDKFRQLSLDRRFVPLSYEDMEVLEKVSFRRELEPIAVSQWTVLDPESVWADILEITSCYKVFRMAPEFRLGETELVCVESSNGSKGPTDIRNDILSEFEVGFATTQELQLLVNDFL